MIHRMALALALGACGGEPSSSVDRGADAAGEARVDSHDATSSAEAGADWLQPCELPSGTTALCLSFVPEDVRAEAAPELDLHGVLELEVFDTPAPLDGSQALFRAVVPRDFESGAEVSITSLPEVTIVLEAPRDTVYVRAHFFDHPGSFHDEAARTSWGVWYGGMGFPDGLGPVPTLEPVPLNDGTATRQEMTLHAKRRLSVTVTTSATLLGDGEGALSLMASRIPALPPEAPTYGYGIEPCVDLASGVVHADMFLLGTGRFFVAASFDDLGIETPGAVPPGVVLSVRDFDPETGDGTFDSVTVSADQYVADVSLDLGYVLPLPDGSGSPGPNSCRDLGLPYQ